MAVRARIRRRVPEAVARDITEDIRLSPAIGKQGFLCSVEYVSIDTIYSVYDVSNKCYLAYIPLTIYVN